VASAPGAFRVQRHRDPGGRRRFYKIGIVLTPAAGAVLMSLSTIIVAINARLLRLERASVS
jgi:hypothetical protein